MCRSNSFAHANKAVSTNARDLYTFYISIVLKLGDYFVYTKRFASEIYLLDISSDYPFAFFFFFKPYMYFVFVSTIMCFHMLFEHRYIVMCALSKHCSIEN